LKPRGKDLDQLSDVGKTDDLPTRDITHGDQPRKWEQMIPADGNERKACNINGIVADSRLSEAQRLKGIFQIPRQ
jgi:hypothetical protein